jgi:IS30 family transposase
MTQTKNSTTLHYQQLKPEERGIIQASLTQKLSLRQIAKRLHRSPSTISREVKRGTVQQRNTDYLFFKAYYANAGQAIYEKHRANCHAVSLLKTCRSFFMQLTDALKHHPRVDSIDTFVHRFKSAHPQDACSSVSTVYRYIDQGLLKLRNSDLPKKLRRRVKGTHFHKRHNKKILGTSIEKRPDIVQQRTKFGHWGVI